MHQATCRCGRSAGSQARRRTVADDVELRAGQMILVVDVRHIDHAVRIASHERLAGGRTRAADRPVVAAAELGCLRQRQNASRQQINIVDGRLGIPHRAAR